LERIAGRFSGFMKILRYFARLTAGRMMLWCYLVWYLTNVAFHFDPRPRLWLTSIGLSVIIGTALLVGTRSASKGTTRLDGWQIFRLYLMPFCVSSFSALVKDAGYVLIFSPDMKENGVGFALMAAFLSGALGLRRTRFSERRDY
jgi:hypothetical protein